MKSRKRLIRYNSFRQKTKELCSNLIENTIISDCISKKAMPIYNVRIFQDGVIKITVQKPKKNNLQYETFCIGGNHNIVGSKEAIESVFASSITNNIKNFN